MNKKAMTLGVLVAILFILLVAIVMYSFTSSVTSSLKEDTDIETCRLSVLAQAQTRKVPIVDISAPKTLIPLDCPRRNLKIYDNKVEINGQKSQKYSFKKLTEEELNHIIAEELRLCWYKMVEGKPNVFEESILFFNTKEENTCLICSEVTFDDKVKGRVYGGLIKYLNSKNIPTYELSYYGYLVRSQRDTYTSLDIPWAQWTPWGVGTTSKIEDENINTNQKYSIYFLAFVPSFLRQSIGAYSRAYYIGLGKEDVVDDMCKSLVN